MPDVHIIQRDYLQRAVPPLNAYKQQLNLARQHVRGYVRNALLKNAELHYRRHRLFLKAARMTETMLKEVIIELVGITVDFAGLDIFQLAQIFDRLIDECELEDVACMRLALRQQLDAFAAESVLRSLYISLIRQYAPTFTGVWHHQAVNTDRLSALAAALSTCTPDNFQCLLTLLGAAGSTYPEVDAALRQRYLSETYAALRTRLHDNPTADVTLETTSYKQAVEAAFSVSFATVSAGFDWNFIALHFARQGLEATANAFKACSGAGRTRGHQPLRALSAHHGRDDVRQHRRGGGEFRAVQSGAGDGLPTPDDCKTLAIWGGS